MEICSSFKFFLKFIYYIHYIETIGRNNLSVPINEKHNIDHNILLVLELSEYIRTCKGPKPSACLILPLFSFHIALAVLALIGCEISTPTSTLLLILFMNI